MRRKTLHNAKIVITVVSNKATHKLTTIAAFDNREQKALSEEYLIERGIKDFLNLEDMKETLNWNLNGDASKYQFKWGRSDRDVSEGIAYVFD